jgi:hypothetical protein
LDFLLWGYTQGLVYETPVETQHDRVARIAVAARTIWEMLGIPEEFSIIQTGGAVGGRHFEQLL